MKQSLLLLLTGLLAAPLAAQVMSNTPSSAAPASVLVAAPVATKQPTVQAAAKKKKPAKPSKLTSLTCGPATIAGSNINVRALATIASEVVTRLQRGEPVTILEIVTLKETLEGEPAQWAKICYPTNAHVFVHTSFVNPTNKTVAASKLNLRAGPGENHSVVGRLQHGDAINEITTKDMWIEIESPTNAVAFVAVEYLVQDVPAVTATAPPVAAMAEAPAAVVPTEIIVTNTPVEPAPTAVMDTNAPAPATATDTNAVPLAAAAAAPTTDTNAPATLEATAPPPEPEPVPKRIVQREGKVRYTTSIQAPGYFELADLYQSHTMNYLVSPSVELDLKRYYGRHVLITGEEGLDRRWPNMPVLIVQKIQLAD